MRRLRILSALIVLTAFFQASLSWAQGMSRTQRPLTFKGSRTVTPFIPQGVNPSLHDPFHSLYEWKIDHNPYDEPCHYDETYGQWVGPCNSSLDQPGFSITVPNRIRR